jgi:elongation factor G
MKLVVTTPEEYLGDVTGDLNKRRGHLEHVESMIGYQAVHAKVPLAEMFGYVTALRSITSGRASSNMEFFEYAEVPKDLVEEILYKIKGYKVTV